MGLKINHEREFPLLKYIPPIDIRKNDKFYLFLELKIVDVHPCLSNFKFSYFYEEGLISKFSN